MKKLTDQEIESVFYALSYMKGSFKDNIHAHENLLYNLSQCIFKIIFMDKGIEKFHECFEVMRRVHNKMYYLDEPFPKEIFDIIYL
jgi:hypothetical protein